MFTGDRSGDFLYRALYRAGFASQPTSVNRDDGLELHDAWITAAGHCAPPDNKPLPGELRNCRPFLEREIAALGRLKLVVVLGKIAFDAWRAVSDTPRDCKFGHNVLCEGKLPVLCSYHPSQQNTSTGRLTQEMLDRIFLWAWDLIRS
jgi:uracil-DNA glycosylase